MNKIFLFALTLLITTNIFAQQAKHVIKRKPEFGIYYGYTAGGFKFPSGSIYAQSPLDQFKSTEIGGFARLFLSDHLYLQPEFSHYSRKLYSDFQYKYLIELIGQTVFYKVDGQQTLNEAALSVGYRYDFGKLRTFASAGMALAFQKEKVIAQTENAFGGGWTSSPIESSDGGTGLVLGLGAGYQFTKRLGLFAEGRFGLYGTTWKTFEPVIQMIEFPTSVRVTRYSGRVGLTWLL